MSTEKEINYEKIWRYLRGELSTEEEDLLLEWMAKKERNQRYFDEVVLDFHRLHDNDIQQLKVEENTPPPGFSKRRKYHNLRLLNVAASVVTALFLGWLFFLSINQDKPLAKNQYVLLPDSTQIFLTAGSELIYDANTFSETKAIKIKGSAEVLSPNKEESVILIETSQGYYVATNGHFSVSSAVKGKIEFSLKRGESYWLSASQNSTEIAVVPGEKITVITETGFMYKQSHQVGIVEKSRDSYILNNLFIKFKI